MFIIGFFHAYGRVEVNLVSLQNDRSKEMIKEARSGIGELKDMNLSIQQKKLVISGRFNMYNTSMYTKEGYVKMPL